MDPSPKAHIYRLLLLLALFAAGFVGIRSLAIPPSWVSEGSSWYRGDALTELQQLPLRFGGNASCANGACHETERRENHQSKLASLGQGGHQGLACEGCHGPFSAHVASGTKVAAANRESSAALCLNCHASLTSRPKHHTQFSETFPVHQSMQVKATTPCRACHDPHKPK